MVVSLILNIALLVALTVVQQTVVRRWRPGTVPYILLSGILFGGVAILGMMTPVVMAEGIIYDGRSIILGIAGLFTGPVAGGIAALMAAAYRLYLGGAGAVVGVAVIIEATALGVVFHYLRRKGDRALSWPLLLALGLLVHVVMLALQFAIPGGVGPEIVRRIALPVLVIYPLGMLLVARLMLDQEERYQREQRVSAMNETLEREVAQRITELAEANEELASMNEELTSMNEELAAVNEELEAANRAKSDFLASMSHEFRTPLNSIIGFTDVLLSGMAGELEAEQRTQIGMVNASGRHLLALVNDVLDLAKIEAGKLVPELAVFDLARELEAVVGTMRPQAEAKGLLLTSSLCRAHIEVKSDARMVRQIVLNLLSNAVKFTDRGTVSLDAQCDDDGLRIEVADTGPGIAPEHQARIFEAFTQLEGHAGLTPDGTGLGLAISSRLARALGGELRLESTPGKGSRFTLALPAACPGSVT
ncbi:MAG: hypothetical protein Kow0067_03470 [Coriobacteriia bacterium]